MLPSTPEGALMAASGMSPAQTILERREGRFAERIIGRPLTKEKDNYPNHGSL
jgi:hypothetical protein